MRINEVEALVGISKKNIRFYESEGLLCPRRNSANGYRDYGEAEVACLERIKLLRKLGLPLEDIRALRRGGRTVGEAMEAHLRRLARQRQELDASARMCEALRGRTCTLEELDARSVLAEMETLEEKGATFMDKQKRDVKRRCLAPIAAALVMLVLMGGVFCLILEDFQQSGTPPVLLAVFCLALPAVTVIGVLIALVQRLREIGRNEIDEAKKY